VKKTLHSGAHDARKGLLMPEEEVENGGDSEALPEKQASKSRSLRLTDLQEGSQERGGAAQFLGELIIQTLFRSRVAAVVVDAAGQIRMVSPQTVRLLEEPVVKDEDLEDLDDETVVRVMLERGDDEDKILGYLTERTQIGGR